ncbi:MAG: Hsp33 family molecular chaperone HslO [Verrucomicrobiales bacterium]|nr:Hsp33 family molecular chaperone HslO [Verrucomicrobiales bacterium]
MSDQPQHEHVSESHSEARCYFVRSRNALAVRACFGPIFTDYYLHLMQHSLKLEPEHDRIFKHALAAFTLYLASRPWKEITAWTANFQDPLFNLFVTGNSLAGNVSGRVFTKDVKHQETSKLYSQVTTEGQETRQSIIEFDGSNFFDIAERFHLQSDQRLARFFNHSGDDYVLVAAQPDCDTAWLKSLTPELIRTLDEQEELSLLESRRYRFHCGCDTARVVAALSPLSTAQLDELFDSRQTIPVTCPRCAALFELTRDEIEASRQS